MPSEKLKEKNNMQNKILTLFLLCLSLCCKANLSMVAEADSAYLHENYKEAIELYGMTIEQHGVSAPLLYNLGNAYYQDGDIAQAVLCYERARKLDPSNAEVNANLKYLRNKVEDSNKSEQKGKRLKVTEDESTFFQSLNTSISENTASNTWAGWAAACFILFAGCAALYIFTRNVMLRKTGFFGGIILLGLSVIFVVFAYMGAARYFSEEYGIVMSYKSPLLSEPDNKVSAEKSEIITRGTKVRIISEEVDAEGKVTWYKVRLNSDYIGWIPSEDLAVI